MANEAQMKFSSAATTVISESAADITSGAVNGGDTELDNSTDLYPLATATLYLPDGWVTTAPVDGETVDLYMVRKDVDGINNDSDETTTTEPENAEYVGSFLCTGGAVGVAFRKTITISLTGVKAADFYIENSTSYSLDYNATAITVKVHPFTFAPAV
jgi:hypothetical protein